MIRKKFKPGDYVYVVTEDEVEGYLYMGECNDCTIVCTENARWIGDFQSYLEEMLVDSYDNYGITVELFKTENVFSTEEAANAAWDILMKG